MPISREEYRAVLRGDMIRQAQSRAGKIPDIVDVFPIIRRADVAVAVYADEDEPDGFGWLVLKGDVDLDYPDQAVCGQQLWEAIPLPDHTIAEAVRRIVASPGR